MVSVRRPGITTLARALRVKESSEETMAKCDVCGNNYEQSFEVNTAGGKRYTFDSFECAIHQLAPECEHCGCRIIGHGVQSDGRYYCCAHCAHEEGVTEVVDNAEHAAT
jgi:hypothetical protein